MEQMVLVRRVVPRNYYSVTFDGAAFSNQLNRSLQRVVPVKTGDTLSGVIQKEFRASSSWTPGVYEALEAHISEINGLTDPVKDLKGGATLRLPDMPTGSRVASAHVDLAHLQSKITRPIYWDLPLRASPEIPKAAGVAAAWSPTEQQLRKIPLSVVQAMKFNPNATREEQEATGDYQVLQGEIPLTLGNATTASGLFINEDEQALLTEFMTRPSTTKPLLVVLDDGWPSQDDFQRAAKFVTEASIAIRSSFSLQNPNLAESADIQALREEQQRTADQKVGTTFCDSDCEYPRLKSHASMIRKSLEQLREADKKNLVEVIYLPLNRAPRFARQVLGEMMRVTQLADSVSDQLVLKTSGGTIPADAKPGKPDFLGVEDIVRDMLSPDYLGIGSVAGKSGELTVTTDKAVVDAVVNFLVLYSMASHRPHFLSMSWTTANLRLPALFRANGYGLWLAAAGNAPNIDVHEKLVQYAARSSDPGDIIAVENTASAGCDSSNLSADPGLPVYGFAFSGRVTEALCGTSFSTPRVAWLLAANEAVKGKAVVPGESKGWTQWRAKRKEALMKLTKPNAPGEQRYRASMASLLEGMPQ